MATAEQADVDNAASKEKRPKFEFEYKFIKNRRPGVTEELRKIGILLDAELKAEEEQARKANT